MKASECFQKRLLRRANPDPLKVTKALEMAEMKKERSQDLFENDFFEESIVSSYTSMFQAARALLFHDGVIEKKSCLCRRIPQRTLFIYARAG